ncbi:MAG: pantetheine-phosphate adenylyltransferase [Lachnospiraceae bacterium]|nr:pantetheine-phosphate adenylyltransferase [Lachnospiraceae bacterium]
MITAIYPGSFDPITFGHLDIIKRSVRVVDELIVGVVFSHNAKNALFSVDERVRMIEEVTKDLEHVKVVPFRGLLIDFAKDMKADVIIRGLRAITDFEYELQMSQTNHRLHAEIETMFLTTSVEYSYLSSSVVKEVAKFGGDVSQFVPEISAMELRKKMKQKGECK